MITLMRGRGTVINTKYVIQGSLQSKNIKFFHAQRPIFTSPINMTNLL